MPAKKIGEIFRPERTTASAQGFDSATGFEQMI
jgi:hypothetical protein